MLQPLLIVLVAALLLHDAQGRILAAPGVELAPAVIAALSVGPQAVLAAALVGLLALMGAALDRTGRAQLLSRAELYVLLSRIGATAVHVCAVLSFGFLDVVRAWMGNWVLLDEAVALAPPLVVFVAGWWGFYPIERRVHEALLVRALDEGLPVHPMPSRLVYTLDKFRHQALIIIAPIAMIFAWTETLNLLLAGAVGRMEVFRNPETAGIAMVALQALGVIAILILAPLFIRYLWSTRPLGPGPLRDRLEALCRAHGVRIRRMLVWRTHGTMINGAVMGLIGRLRYILLTDALLDSMAGPQIEAVMAHEVAHVRRRHLPWLMAALAASLGLGALAVGIPAAILLSAIGAAPGGLMMRAIDAAALMASLAAGLIVFGFVSRKFERQADAFAVQHLSGMTKANCGRGVVVTPEAAEAMAGALQVVAELNHIPREKFTWRHGSISGRQSAIIGMIGEACDGLAIDREAKWMKWGAGIALVVVVGVAVGEEVLLR